MGVSTDGLIFYGILFGEELSEHIINKIFDLSFEDFYPFNIENYCSGDYPMYVLVIKESVIRASRGYPSLITKKEFRERKDWDEALIKFCKENELEYQQKPNWYLGSYWG